MPWTRLAPRTLRVSTSVGGVIGIPGNPEFGQDVATSYDDGAYVVAMEALMAPAFTTFVAPGLQESSIALSVSLRSSWRDLTADAVVGRTEHEQRFAIPAREVIARSCDSLTALEPHAVESLAHTAAFAANAPALLGEVCPSMALEPLFCSGLDEVVLAGPQEDLLAEEDAGQLDLESRLTLCEATADGQQRLAAEATQLVERLSQSPIPSDRAALGADVTLFTRSLLGTQQKQVARTFVVGLLDAYVQGDTEAALAHTARKGDVDPLLASLLDLAKRTGSSTQAATHWYRAAVASYAEDQVAATGRDGATVPTLERVTTLLASHQALLGSQEAVRLRKLVRSRLVDHLENSLPSEDGGEASMQAIGRLQSVVQSQEPILGQREMARLTRLLDDRRAIVEARIERENFGSGFFGRLLRLQLVSGGVKLDKGLIEDILRGGLDRIMDSGFIKYPHETELVDADTPMQDAGILWTDAGKAPVAQVAIDFAIAAPNAFGVKSVHVLSVCTLVRTDNNEVLSYSIPQHLDGRQRPRSRQDYTTDLAGVISMIGRAEPEAALLLLSSAAMGVEADKAAYAQEYAGNEFMGGGPLQELQAQVGSLALAADVMSGKPALNHIAACPGWLRGLTAVQP